MAKFPRSTGSVPRGKAGSRTVDHPSMGKGAMGGNKPGGASTSHAGGKPLSGMGAGAGKKCKDPGVKCHAQGPQGKQAGGY